MTEITVDQRFGVATAISIAGGVTALCIMVGSRQFGGDLAFLRVALGGAFLAGLFLAGGFGRDGIAGGVLACASFVAATFLGAVLAVWLLPFDTLWMLKPVSYMHSFEDMAAGVMGPIYVLISVMEQQLALAGWVLSGVGVHVLSMVLRAR